MRVALFSLVFSLMATSIVFSAPINNSEKRELAVSCGGRRFTSAQVARGVDNSEADAASSTTYPHQYK